VTLVYLGKGTGVIKLACEIECLVGVHQRNAHIGWYGVERAPLYWRFPFFYQAAARFAGAYGFLVVDD